MRKPRPPRLRSGQAGLTQLGAGSSAGRSYCALEARTATKDPAGVSPVLYAMSERVFQAHVVAGLRNRGWRVFIVPDMRKTTRGLPDLICVHPERKGRMLAWELKSQTGRVRPEQRQIINCLATVPGVDARIVRPTDWPALLDWLDATPAHGREPGGEGGR